MRVNGQEEEEGMEVNPDFFLDIYIYI